MGILKLGHGINLVWSRVWLFMRFIPFLGRSGFMVFLCLITIVCRLAIVTIESGHCRISLSLKVIDSYYVGRYLLMGLTGPHHRCSCQQQRNRRENHDCPDAFMPCH